MEYIIYTVVAAIAFWLGWHVRGVIIMLNISSDPDRMIKILEKVKQINSAQTVEELTELAKAEVNLVGAPDSIELTIERVDNMLYGYNKHSGQFIAQGSDLSSLLDIAHKRFPSKVIIGNIETDNPAKELV